MQFSLIKDSDMARDMRAEQFSFNKNMTTLHLKLIGPSPLRFGFLLVPLALA